MSSWSEFFGPAPFPVEIEPYGSYRRDLLPHTHLHLLPKAYVGYNGVLSNTVGTLLWEKCPPVTEGAGAWSTATATASLPLGFLKMEDRMALFEASVSQLVTALHEQLGDEAQYYPVVVKLADVEDDADAYRHCLTATVRYRPRRRDIDGTSERSV